MTEIERIARMFKQTFEGSPYYGPSTLSTLNNITTENAVYKPQWSAHSIWELVNHIIAELQYAMNVFDRTADLWVEGQTTWPVQTDISKTAWQKSLQNLKKTNHQLIKKISQFDDSILEQKPYRVRGPYYLMLHGTLQHVVFHTGQISLLAGQFNHPLATQPEQ